MTGASEWTARTALGLLALFSIQPTLSAQGVEDFYRDRSIDMVVGGGSGGGVDIFARLVAKHLAAYIPGGPSIVARNMPAAGGIAGVSYLFNRSPRDGSALGTMARGPLLEPLIGTNEAQFDPTKFGWIGSVSKEVSICAAWHTTSFKTIDDAKQREMTVAGTGGSSETDTFPVMLNQIIGTKFHLIRGYRGTQDTLLAIERGEVDGRCGWGLSSIMATNPDWMTGRKITVLLQMALEGHPTLKGVPVVTDLVDRSEDIQLLRLFLGTQAMARPFFTTPEVPNERLRALRTAFSDMTKDTTFIAEAHKLNVEVEPTTGETIESILREIYASPADVIARAKALTSARQ